MPWRELRNGIQCQSQLNHPKHGEGVVTSVELQELTHGRRQRCSGPHHNDSCHHHHHHTAAFSAATATFSAAARSPSAEDCRVNSQEAARLRCPPPTSACWSPFESLSADCTNIYAYTNATHDSYLEAEHEIQWNPGQCRNGMAWHSMA